MNIIIGSDHAAIGLKTAVIAHLTQKGHKVHDAGPMDTTPCDYPDYAKKVCDSVASGAHALGILVCGTGIGMSIAANKIKGIRCALCADTFSARMTKLHNDANVMAIGTRTTGEGLALDIVDAFVETPFSKEERHQVRIDKMMALEQ